KTKRRRVANRFNGAVSLPTRNDCWIWTGTTDAAGFPLQWGRVVADTECRGVLVVADVEYGLQWGRVVADTEWAGECYQHVRLQARFNGAVSLPTRNAITHYVDVSVSLASMGPCRCRHGMKEDEKMTRQDIMLQWGRVVADTECLPRSSR